jgi:hypothetical protein
MIRPLSSREKWLAGVVAAVLVIGATALLIDGYMRQRTALRVEISSRTKQLRLARKLAEDLNFWQQRDEWLRTAQPKLSDGDAAGVQLLDRVKELAQKHSVLLENPALRPADRQASYTSVAVEVETKSAWAGLVEFLRELQSPEEFIALENANLKIDPADPTQLRGRFKIARWFAPQ